MHVYDCKYLVKIQFFNLNSRIWGEQGQAALKKAPICLLNCGPTGSETLKNLVLGGVGSITVIDGSKVELGDLGNNFLGMLLDSRISILIFLCPYVVTYDVGSG